MRDWLQKLLFWTSPAFPVGAFSYSHGLEWFVESGDVATRKDLESFILALIEFGDLQADAAFLAAAYRAVDPKTVADVLVDAANLRGAAELAAESTDQGRAFVKALDAAGEDHPHLAAFVSASSDLTDDRIPHAVAFGAAAFDAGIPVDAAAEAWLHAAAANLVSAGQRLVPLGQRDGVAALTAMKPAISGAAERAVATPLKDIVSTSIAVDIAAMFHETQYTRLFRS